MPEKQPAEIEIDMRHPAKRTPSKPYLLISLDKLIEILNLAPEVEGEDVPLLIAWFRQAAEEEGVFDKMALQRWDAKIREEFAETTVPDDWYGVNEDGPEFWFARYSIYTDRQQLSCGTITSHGENEREAIDRAIEGVRKTDPKADDRIDHIVLIDEITPIASFTNYYRCPDCETEWEDPECGSMHNDRCPDCNHEIEPYKSEAYDEAGNELFEEEHT